MIKKDVLVKSINNLINVLDVNNITIPVIASSLVLLHKTMTMCHNVQQNECKYDYNLIIWYVGNVFTKICNSDNSHELCEQFYDNFAIETSEEFGLKKKHFFPVKRFNTLVSEGKVTPDFVKVCKKHVGEITWVFKEYLVNFSSTDNFVKSINFFLDNCVTSVQYGDVKKYFRIDNIKELVRKDISVWCYCGDTNEYIAIPASEVYRNKF